MKVKLEFREIQQVSNDILQELSMLLINVVDDGASIGFLPPLSMQNAEKRATAEGRSLLVLDTRLGDPSNLLYKSIGYIEAGRIPKYAQSANGCLDETVFYYKEI
ncbi:hypothetical protein CLHOM_09560 [Clostridium homopropionicum DSM 5847]|uniref:Uncharacterized protein n=1 Tax=Clostridium homopropionicum DSM 5847 TaxID=1121318 RepID=A0A0L6ZDE9_9CLOT|nr:hypothetical protein [Clostridium homopropionicum]KOA20813.1 hypothetical protein CLHOM_09560 [Clostridium homopropionicum DSM 5847]SFF88488.1 hypothetical protein SAMN04488501_10341 [Clostridium homopropionicum]